MKIEVGKYYRTRDGRKVGPMVYEGVFGDGYPFTENEIAGFWSEFGKRQNIHLPETDLIAEWTEPETGTLAELDVKPGDVVECVHAGSAPLSYVPGREYTVGGEDERGMEISSEERYSTFRIISRASDTPMRCAECDCEKGGDDCNWIASYTDDTFFGLSANRFTTEELQHIADHVASELSKRLKPEPVRETVTLYGRYHHSAWDFWDGYADEDTTHRITFTTTDGKPDLDSIKMEALG